MRAFLAFLLFPVAAIALASAIYFDGGQPLQQDCVITATEAVARLAPTASWSRILLLRYTRQNGVTYNHALAVWIAPTSTNVCSYDKTGTLELPTQSRDANVIGATYCKAIGVLFRSADFLK